MGGPERVERQRVAGQAARCASGSTCCSTPGSFVEYGLLADSHGPGAGRPRARWRPTAWSPASARSTAGGWRSCAYDFTVMAGSMGAVGEHKTARIRELVLRQRIPIVWLLDSGGARIQSTTGSTFAGAGALFREQVTLSGVVPQVGAMLGHCAAGTAYIPALTDFVPMVKGTSSMALGGRHLVKAATGEDVSEEEMGGSEVHNKSQRRRRPGGRQRRGVPGDGPALPVVLPVATTPSRRRSPSATIRSTAGARSSTTSSPPRPGGPTTSAGWSRPWSTTASFLEMKPHWARNIVIALARVGGQPGRHRWPTSRWCSAARST